MAQGLVAIVQSADKPLGALKTTVIQHNRRLVRQVVEQRRRVFEEKRQVALHARVGDAVAHVLVDLASAHVHIERVVPALAKASDARGVEWNLLRGQDPHRVDAFYGALGIRIEGPQAVDLVVVEVDPEGQPGPHRKDVHQRPAHGVFAAFGHGADIAISGALQAYALGVDGEPTAGFEHERLRFDKGRRRQALHQRLYRSHQHAALHSRQGIERRQPLRDDVLVRRKVVVRQRFPVGEGERLGSPRSEKTDLPADALGVLGVARDVQYEVVGLGYESRGGQARTAAEQGLPVARRTRRGNVDVRRVHGRLGRGRTIYSSRYGPYPKPGIGRLRRCRGLRSGARR